MVCSEIQLAVKDGWYINLKTKTRDRSSSIFSHFTFCFISVCILKMWGSGNFSFAFNVFHLFLSVPKLVKVMLSWRSRKWRHRVAWSWARRKPSPFDVTDFVFEKTDFIRVRRLCGWDCWLGHLQLCVVDIWSGKRLKQI